MKLIINADDFGLSKSISDGIIEGINDGFITSTSMMANMKYAEYAIKQAIKHHVNCIGLHINLTVGKPILKNSNLVDENGVFLSNKKQIENTKLTYEDAYHEIKAQFHLIKKYSNGMIKIDHIDTHHCLFDNENIKKALIDIAKEYNIPMRNQFDCDVRKPDILYKDFTINNISIDSLEEMISKYQEKDMVVELMTHPGYIDDYTKTVTICLDRDHELQVLKMAKEKRIFDKVELINFQQL